MTTGHSPEYEREVIDTLRLVRRVIYGLGIAVGLFLLFSIIAPALS